MSLAPFSADQGATDHFDAERYLAFLFVDQVVERGACRIAVSTSQKPEFSGPVAPNGSGRSAWGATTCREILSEPANCYGGLPKPLAPRHIGLLLRVNLEEVKRFRAYLAYIDRLRKGETEDAQHNHYTDYLEAARWGDERARAFLP